MFDRSLPNLSLEFFLRNESGGTPIKWEVNHCGEQAGDPAIDRGRDSPMVRQLLGSALKGVSVEQGFSGEEPGSPAPYVTTCHLLFDSVQAFQTSFGPHAQEIMEDIPKYTNSEPLIQIGEVQL